MTNLGSPLKILPGRARDETSSRLRRALRFPHHHRTHPTFRMVRKGEIRQQTFIIQNPHTTYGAVSIRKAK